MSFRLAFFSVVPFAFFILIAPEVGAQTCGTSVCTESEFCVADDGVIANIEDLTECGLYFIGYFVGPAGLENIGGFPVGTQVHIEGCADFLFGFCPVFLSIRDNTIELPEPDALTALGSGIAMLALLYRRRAQFRVNSGG
jgi:hypothetical protein